ncbi:MAG: rRNA pseudouridine synthase [Thermoleophilaceae bacterium]|nr:rRNA pseudouridine synthase [Thermoleophilaceae bacterium]
MRLAKYLAHAGVASRRGAEEVVFDGRVEVDGRIITDPARDVDDNNDIRVDGKQVGIQSTVVYAVNKPIGVISAASDPQGRGTVVELVGTEQRLYPVGRLDVNSTGLILVTNDGELANLLTHPRYEVPKTYHVRLRGGPPLHRRELEKLARGVELDDGMTLPADIERLAQREFQITLYEGRNRQVRRMCEAIDRDVASLERVGFGGLTLGHLKQGKVRRLGPGEVDILRQSVNEKR